jgi:poly(hydroxyalkanoate) depolymerase family esterase
MTVLTKTMREALRLTREGSLRDATRVIQLALRGPEDARPADINRVARSSVEYGPCIPPVSTETLRPALPAPHVIDTASNPAAAHGRQGRWVAGRFSAASGSRTYKLWVPRANKDFSPSPLIVMLHGCTQDADDFALGTRMNAHGDRLGFHVLYPNQDAAANPQRCWRWFDEGHQHRESGEPAILAAMVKQVIGDHGIDRQRVYVAGLSAGGAMAMVLGATHPDLFAAAAVHSGLPLGAARDIPGALAAMAGRSAPRSPSREHPIPGIVFHGEADRTVRSSNGDRVVLQLQQRFETGGTALTRRVVNEPTHTTTTFHAGDGRVLIEHWLVKGGGHAWFGGEPAGSHTAPSGPDASTRMVEFLLAHSRSTLR